MMYKRKSLIYLVALSIMSLLPFAVSAQITNSITIYSESDLDAYGSWPITINGGASGNPVVVTLGADIILTEPTNSYFIIGGDYVTFDGNNHTITINTGTSYPGLINNGSFVYSVNGYSNITIKNIELSAPTDQLINTAGWIGQEGFGYNATNVTIDNCHSNTTIISTNGGGIVGRSSSATINNCSSSGTIGSGGGGIAGRFFSGMISNCYSTGNIGTNAGGIIGSFSIGTAINCYSTGNIGFNGGGIMGTDAGNNGFGYIPGATVTNCYSRGNITGIRAGGIMAQKSFGTVTNCYSTGNIMGTDSGGIVGYLSSATITNCYTIGTEGTYSRGITGSVFSGAITNCLSSYSGSWSDSNASSVLTGTDGTVWVGYGLELPYTFASNTTGSIITTANFGSFTTYSGVSSDTQTMTVSGTSLQSDVTINAPAGYELSTSPAGTFSSSLALSPTSGTLDATTLYIRLTSSVVNGASGDITIASTGSTTQNIATGIAVLQSASTNIYGSKTIDGATRINKNGAIGISGVSSNGKIIHYLPSLSATSLISAINGNTAVSGGAILSNGGSAITASGVCWSLSPNPTTADSKTIDGTALSFTSNLTGLIAGTIYYVRAYATNSEGTSYGKGVSFTAL